MRSEQEEEAAGSDDKSRAQLPRSLRETYSSSHKRRDRKGGGMKRINNSNKTGEAGKKGAGKINNSA